MKIAFIYDAFIRIKGGAEKRIYEIARRLADRHEFRYGVGWWLDGSADGSKNENGKVMEHDGIILHPVCKPVQLYVDGRRSIGEAIYFASKLMLGLMKERFDVIDCQEFPYFPCFSAKVHSLVKRSALVITWHEIWGDYWFEYLGKKGFFGWAVEKLTAKLTGRNVAVSEKTKKDLEGIGVKNIEVIPNGIDFKRIQEIKKADEESDIIFAGRLIKEKNVDVLIKAVKIVKEEIPDVRCIIIGDGPEKQKLERLARDLKLEENVKFTGFLENHDDVISYMKASKVFVLPSVREGFGIVALEANACGLPVVTVDHCRNAARDVIRDGVNGFVCGVSEEEIAERIKIALKKNVNRDYVEFARTYDWDNIVKRCIRLYRRSFSG